MQCFVSNVSYGNVFMQCFVSNVFVCNVLYAMFCMKFQCLRCDCDATEQLKNQTSQSERNTHFVKTLITGKLSFVKYLHSWLDKKMH